MNAAMWKPLALTIAVDHLDRASHIFACTVTLKASRVYSSITVSIFYGRPELSLSCTKSTLQIWFWYFGLRRIT